MAHELSWNLKAYMEARGIRVGDLVRQARRLGYPLSYGQAHRLLRERPDKLSLSTVERVIAILESLTGEEVRVEDLLGPKESLPTLPSDPLDGVGSRLKALREAKGLSIGALSHRSGVSEALISRLERGMRRPSYYVLGLLAEALGVSPKELLGGER